MLSLVIGMINQFIEIVTVALIGFTSLSLVVSTFMIAIITYVSVVERVKEIGVIRSLGGRKKDVSRLFTAETAIIGLVSGLFGIGVTYLVSAIINAIVGSVSIISQIAIFPWFYALIMVGVSVALTLISGVFPASAAAKKDPVIALRTE
jgi:putative ABC transport system permease protein